MELGVGLSLVRNFGGSIPFSPGGKNLMLYSEQLDNAAWNVFAQTAPTPDYAAAPDGTMTAERFLWTQVSGPPYRFQDVAVPAGGVAYVFSFYHKSTDGSAHIFAARDLIGAPIGLITAGASWQRGSFAFTSGGLNTRCGFDFRTGAGADSTGDVLIWGGQLELGSTAGFYQKTTNVAVP